jgi:hypothetical protein
MTLPDLLDPDGDLWLVLAFLAWTWGAWRVWRGALIGARGHARPRLFVGVGMTTIALLYIADLTGAMSPDWRQAGVRVAGIWTALALGFTANTGVRFGHKVTEAAAHLEALAADNEGGDSSGNDRT